MKIKKTVVFRDVAGHSFTIVDIAMHNLCIMRGRMNINHTRIIKLKSD